MMMNLIKIINYFVTVPQYGTVLCTVHFKLYFKKNIIIN